MTLDALNNSNSGAHIYESQIASRVDGVTSNWETVNVNTEIVKEHWEAALASAADALVLVQWLESKRT